MRTPDPARVEAVILSLLAERTAGGDHTRTICPSEAARLLARQSAPGITEALPRSAWEPLMDDVRLAGRRLAAEGRIVVTQRGAPVDLYAVRGPIRFRLR